MFHDSPQVVAFGKDLNTDQILQSGAWNYLCAQVTQRHVMAYRYVMIYCLVPKRVAFAKGDKSKLSNLNIFVQWMQNQVKNSRYK